MSTYRVELSARARKQFRVLDPQVRRRVTLVLRQLEDEPRPAGVKMLVGTPLYRVRIGDWRVLYEVDDEEVLVLVVEIGHRREVYRSR